ncbi:MAG: DNA polymerase III subunit alpha [Clostridia bacterium]|nr:DNA polymerase III subunit alpha [Clostridia bacterium]
MSNSFAHLHLHSEYSLLDGACRVAEIPKKAKAEGHSAVALTDHGVLYGAVNFYKACVKEEVKPIIGCEVYVAPGSRFEKNAGKGVKANHLVLLAENETGYRNLIKLSSLAFTEGFYSKPRVDIDLLREYHKGIIALSACLAGAVPRAVISGDYKGAEEHAKLLLSVFGEGNFFLEVQDHGLADQGVVNDALSDISKRLSIPLVATNDVHYLERKNALDQEVLLCIGTGSVLSDGRPIGFETDEFYYKSTSEMERLFDRFPGAIGAAGEIADRCSVELEFGKTYLPRFTPEGGKTPPDYLKELALTGFDKKVSEGRIAFDGKHPESVYRDRIDYELSVINQMGYDEYFLIVRDYVNFAKSRGIPVGPGRGSGAGSLVAYLVGITDVDSIKYDLIFERFLNPERVSMPDFDIDFCYDRRDEVIEYVKNKYGEEHVCQIVTFGTLAARAAVRDVGRVLGMSYSDVDRVVREIPKELDITVDDALKKNPSLREMYDSDPACRDLLDRARRIEGMPRHASTHAAGVVITDHPVTDYVPVSVTGGTVVTQYTMDVVADLGILKFDFLAFRYLTIINETEKLIKERVPDFDLTLVDTCDKAAYDLISSGKTDGVFQLESRGMKQMLTKLQPSSFNDIIAAIALFRPGPMDSIPRYIEARRDPTLRKYKIPGIDPILESTYGCIVYQEQVMQIFREIAGYSFGHADVVRRAISKKKADVLEKEHEAFVKGSLERGAEEADAEELFSDIVAFADYAFNKSHATAYAVLSFRTAYLKAHFPLEYFCALLTSVLGSEVKTAEYIAEASKAGVKVFPPDVNRSLSGFSVENGNIRFGLSALKNIGPQFISSLIALRESNGLFSDVDDFISRTREIGINKKQFETLIKSGALDSLGKKRSQLLAVFDSVFDSVQSSKIPEGQIDLFATDAGQKISPKIAFPDIPELSVREKLTLEKETSGLYLSGHILDDYSENVSSLEHFDISAIISAFSDDESSFDAGIGLPDLTSVFRDRQRVTVVGIITSRTAKTTKRGDPMAFITVEDKTGQIECIVFSDVLEKVGFVLVPDGVVAVSGSLSVRDGESPKIIVSDGMPLIINSSYIGKEANPEKKVSDNKTHTPITKLFLRVPSKNDKVYKRVIALLEIFPGAVPVVFFDGSTGEYDKGCVASTSVSSFVLSELEKMLGKDNVVPK